MMMPGMRTNLAPKKDNGGVETVTAMRNTKSAKEPDSSDQKK